jgi:hypothetical protein
MPIEFDIDFSALESIARSFGATQRNIEQAANHAIRRTVISVAAEVRRNAASASGIPSSAVRFRMAVTRSSGGGSMYGRVWLGTRPLIVTNLFGRPLTRADMLKTRMKPINIRGRSFVDSFIGMSKRSGRYEVWRRRHAGRLSPIELTSIPVADQWGPIMVSAGERAGQTFMRNFTRDVEYYAGRNR